MSVGTTTAESEFHVHEPSRSAVSSSSGGAIRITHGDNPGTSGLIFRGNAGGAGDYGYLQFCDDCGSGSSSNNAVLEFRLFGEGPGNKVDVLSLASAGGVGINTTVPTATLDVDGDARLRGLPGYSSGTHDDFVVIDASGNLAVRVGGTVTSGRRLKRDIAALPTALPAVRALGAYSFVMRDRPGRAKLGVMAQEVQALFPDMVYTDAAGYLSVDYAQLTPLLLRAVQELAVEADSTRAALARLEARSGGQTGLESARAGSPGREGSPPGE